MAEAFSIEGAQIGFKNFAGREGMYNKEGDRNFVVFLTPEMADKLSKQGWNVKFPKQKEIAPEDDNRQPYLPIDVSFKNLAPKVILINGDEPIHLDEAGIEMLDWVEMQQVDLSVRPYHWDVNGQTGVKAYLKAIYVTIVTDKFMQKYGV